MLVVTVNRHTGGLENELTLHRVTHEVNRHTGGLEKTNLIHVANGTR